MLTDKPIYLDYHATTPVDSRVAEKVMAAMMTQLGNASSVNHAVGDRSREVAEQAKQQIVNLKHNHAGDVWT